ncbi:uncharacterized protein LOC6040921 [Culex quinquefasciatus]|uniref:uncharacterized protein LOC6040921 n=1 Tax=Culex quinquefasciatus TaxID=7176 RepID=UPI0018E2BDCF|nr:uncharacterized protein LOC6040921 [Culex quinquefasciatus]
MESLPGRSEIRWLYCSASMCKLPIRKDEQYHRFWNKKSWIDRLRADGSAGHVVCHRHFSPSQYIIIRNANPKLKNNAVPDQRILCCRFCMDQSVKMERLPAVPSSDPGRLTLQDVVETIGIQVNPAADGIPALICLTCSSKVRYIKRVQRQFQESDLKMRQLQAVWTEENRKLLAETDEGRLVKFVATEKPSFNASCDEKVVQPVVTPVSPDKPVKIETVHDFMVIGTVKKEPGVSSKQVIDRSSNSIFTIETMDAYKDDERGTDSLQLQTEDSIGIPPAKKIKKEII